MPKEPKEVAEGAADRLCHYDAVNQSAEEFYEETAKAVGEFVTYFVFNIAVRLSEAAGNELNKKKLKEIDEALARVREIQGW